MEQSVSKRRHTKFRRREDGTDRVFRNVDIQNSDAMEDGTDRVFRKVGTQNSDAEGIT